MSLHINRIKYANMYGPTTGDKVRLGDTELFIEIEKDHTVYGDEAKFGGGKTIRDGMAQSARATKPSSLARHPRSASAALARLPPRAAHRATR